MKNNNLKLLTRYAILIAMTTVMTMAIRIPTVGTEGYLNLGDMVVLLAALMLGKKGGFIVGSFGSAIINWIYPLYTYYLCSKRARRTYSSKAFRNQNRQ